MDIKKIDENTIEVTETKETVKQYNYSFLKEQLKNIQAQQDADNTQREKEKLEVQNLLDECDKLKIVARADGII